MKDFFVRLIVGLTLGISFYLMYDEEWVRKNDDFIVVAFALYIFIWTIYGGQIVSKIISKIDRKEDGNEVNNNGL